MKIAVDFDGTCVDHRFPDVGPDVPGAVETLRDLIAAGHSLMIWTMRDGDYLEAAKQWWADRGLPYDVANVDPDRWSASPKLYAHVYIDDAALGCPLELFPDFKRPAVDWSAVRSLLVTRGVIMDGDQGG